MAVESDKGFLGRWSARKVAVKEGKPIVEPTPIAPEPLPSKALEAVTEPVPPALTLDDVAVLTPASDFSTFVAKGVDTLVKNAAMKKLFADPHYNIMDGLDIYIGDYSTHAPMPQSVIDEITKDGFLNMFRKEETPAESPPPTENLSHDDPDLQLQRDDAAGREGAVCGAVTRPEIPARLETAQPTVPPPST
jgi:Protein of unknown function (DUF3306)